MADKSGAGVAIVAGQGMGAQHQEMAGAPYHILKAECLRPDGQGGTYVAWRDGYDHNVVNAQGRFMIMHKVYGNLTSSSNGPYLALHNAAATSSGWHYSNLSGSFVAPHSTQFPAITFKSATTDMTTDFGTQSYGFTMTAAGTASISGAAIVYHSSAAMATNAASGGCVLMACGMFANSRTVVANDTLNVSVTVSFGTA